MDITLLGPVRARAGEQTVHLGRPRQRLAFVALALEAGRPVRPEALMDRLWGGSPPQRARESLYVHIARLRANLGSIPELALRRGSSGYVLDIDPLWVDVHRFEHLVTAARQRSCPPERRDELLSAGLALWHGEPLADLDGQWVQGVRQALRAKRLDAVQLWAQTRLGLGDPAATIPALAEMLAAHPFAESLAGLLMRALAASGRTAEALERYTELRTRLADELGTDPSPELQAVHREVLRGERPPAKATADHAVAVPAQLPLDVYGFTGRDREIKQINEIVDGVGVRLVVVTGTAGVGKTALAVRWAHANAGRFGGGQLYLNLRGFEPSAEPVPPAEALARLLHGLGVAPGAVPHDTDGASALYRSMLAGKRTLVLLDNVRDVRQIRPLLPGAPEAMVIATSRHRLDGLLALQGARILTLRPLSPDQALALLATMLGPERVDCDPDSEELARRCAYLPLALRIAAANLACRPAQAIGGYLERMSSPLEALRAEGDDQAVVSAAFDASYAQLSPQARRLFRLSCLCGGNDFDTHTAAALGGLSLVDVSETLAELCAAHLLNEDGEGRYSTHDLLRAYGRLRLSADETPETLAEAARRLVDFYTDTCYRACELFMPRRNRSARDIMYPPTAGLTFSDLPAARRWHDLEQHSFVGAVALARDHGWHKPAWHLAECLFHYFVVSRNWQPWLQVTAIGLASAEASGDGEAVARINMCLGAVRKQTGDLRGARAAWERALAEASAVGHRRLVSGCQVNLGGLCVMEGDPAAGATHLRQALEFTEYSQDPRFGCIVRNNYGCALLHLGRLAEAEAAFTESLAMARAAGDDLHICAANHNLAEISLLRNDPASAMRHAREQLSTAERIRDPLQRARAWDMLGSALCHDDLEQARLHWERALSGYQEMNHRQEEPMRRWLESLGTMGREELVAADGARRHRARLMA
jgi:DNA-binding SARP family transcriptional activator/tetratricopeptide (TPR) repeat protein